MFVSQCIYKYTHTHIYIYIYIDACMFVYIYYHAKVVLFIFYFNVEMRLSKVTGETLLMFQIKAVLLNFLLFKEL